MGRYDVFRFAQNDVASLRFAMMRCLPKNVAKPRIIRQSRHHWALPNIICRRQTSLKKDDCFRNRLFSWQGQKDSVLSLRRKVEEYFDFATRLRYSATPKTRFAHFREPRARGSDSPPDCHSLPLPFKPFRFKSQQKEKPTKNVDFSFWQGQKDLNPRPMVLETSTLPTELYPYALVYYSTYFYVLQAFFEFFLLFSCSFCKYS